MIYTDDIYSTWWFYLIVAGVALVVAAVVGVAYYFLVIKKRNKELKKIENIQKVDKATSEVSLYFKGKENIKDIKLQGSRVIVEVISTDGIIPAKLDEIGLKGAIIMDGKVVFAVGSNSQIFYEELKKKLDI